MERLHLATRLGNYYNYTSQVGLVALGKCARLTSLTLHVADVVLGPWLPHALPGLRELACCRIAGDCPLPAGLTRLELLELEFVGDEDPVPVPQQVRVRVRVRVVGRAGARRVERG